MTLRTQWHSIHDPLQAERLARGQLSIFLLDHWIVRTKDLKKVNRLKNVAKKILDDKKMKLLTELKCWWQKVRCIKHRGNSPNILFISFNRANYFCGENYQSSLPSTKVSNTRGFCLMKTEKSNTYNTYCFNTK